MTLFAIQDHVQSSPAASGAMPRSWDCIEECNLDYEELVCIVGQIRNITSTRCLANCEGKDVECEGPCPCPYCPQNGCPKIYDLVCAEDGNTYLNPCEAKCNGMRSFREGECRFQMYDK